MPGSQPLSHDIYQAVSTDDQKQNLINLPTSREDLEAMSSDELSSLVTTLQIDKSKLQKLVIAQHAVVESLRESNNRSRDLTKDAIKVMYDAQAAQKLAEKIARRERTERQRVQRDYERVANILENAMSIISFKEKGSPSVKTSSA